MLLKYYPQLECDERKWQTNLPLKAKGKSSVWVTTMNHYATVPITPLAIQIPLTGLSITWRNKPKQVIIQIMKGQQNKWLNSMKWLCKWVNYFLRIKINKTDKAKTYRTGKLLDITIKYVYFLQNKII